MPRNETTSESGLNLQREKGHLGADHSDIYDAVIEFLETLHLPERDLLPRDSLAILDDEELDRVRKTIGQYRIIREKVRITLPALHFAIAKLELAAGEYLAAWKSFSAVAAKATGSADRAVAHFNVFRAAMERRNWDSALSALLNAARYDSRFELFPPGRFQPKRLLGGGACGVSILCTDKKTAATVVVKAFWQGEQLREMVDVFDEIRSLEAIGHPNIVRVMECGYADAAGRARPYAVMEFFEGKSLETLVREEGTLASKDVVAIAARVASAVQAAHARNILHRSVKPGNVLVHRKDDKWQVRVLDFGAELREPDIEIAPVSMRSLIAVSLAGTADSAAPEQLGKIAGASVGPASDVYGLARTCFYALFQTPRPNRAQLDFLPKIITDVLEDCLERDPDDRPTMKTLIDDLQRLSRDLQVSTRYVPAKGLRWSDERKGESPQERRGRLRRDAEYREFANGDQGAGYVDRNRAPRRKGNSMALVLVGGILMLFAGFAVVVLLMLNGDRKTSSPANNQAKNSSKKNKRVETATPIPQPNAKQDPPRVNKNQPKKIDEPPKKMEDPPFEADPVPGPQDKTAPKPAKDTKDFPAEEPANGRERSPGEIDVFCSELRGSDIKHGFWPIARKGQLGNPKPFDFTAADALIQVNGEPRINGISMHPPSNGSASISFKLEGKGKRFMSQVALNDAARDVSDDGYFSVHGDGRRLWRSGPFKARGQFENCDVNIAGVKVLELRTTAASSEKNLQMIWLDPRVRSDKKANLESMNDAPKGWVFLSELTVVDFQEGMWPIKKDGLTGYFSREIVVDGEGSPKGIGMHPPDFGAAGLVYNLERKYTKFRGKVALDDSGDGSDGPVLFEIFVDTKRVWQSKPVQKPGRVQEFEINVTSARTLGIQTVAARGARGLHAVWLDPILKVKEKP